MITILLCLEIWRKKIIMRACHGSFAYAIVVLLDRSGFIFKLLEVFEELFHTSAEVNDHFFSQEIRV